MEDRGRLTSESKSIQNISRNSKHFQRKNHRSIPCDKCGGYTQEMPPRVSPQIYYLRLHTKNGIINICHTCLANKIMEEEE